MSTNILNLIDELSDQRKLARHFISPALAGRNKVTVMVDGLPLKLDMVTSKNGWYRYNIDGKVAKSARKATMEQITAYLDNAPKLQMIVGIKLTDDGTYLCYPKHQSSITEPVPVHLCEGVEFFDTIEVAHTGSLWFSRVLYNDFQIKEGLLEQLKEKKEIAEHFKDLTKAYKLVYSLVVSHLMQTDSSWFSDEEKLRKMAENADATINWIRDNGTNWTIQFTVASGATATATINKNFMTQSAGYCLDGDDDKFSFISVIALLNARPTHW